MFSVLVTQIQRLKFSLLTKLHWVNPFKNIWEKEKIKVTDNISFCPRIFFLIKRKGKTYGVQSSFQRENGTMNRAGWITNPIVRFVRSVLAVKLPPTSVNVKKNYRKDGKKSGVRKKRIESRILFLKFLMVCCAEG